MGAPLGSSDGSEKSLETVKSDVPDLVILHGTLEPSALVTEGATLHVSYRTGPSFPGSPAFEWTIAGTKGELRVTGPAGPYLGSDSYGSAEEPEQVRIEVYEFATDVVTNVPWDWNASQNELTVRGRSVAEVYERFAASGEKGAWPQFEEAIALHAELEEIFQSFDRQKTASY